MLYIAKKGSEKFFIQPEMLENYSSLGYDIFKMEEVAVNNVKEEVKAISMRKSIMKNEGMSNGN